MIPHRPSVLQSQNHPNSLLHHSTDRVTVPRVNFVPCASLTALLGQVDPLRQTHDFGECLYFEAVIIVGRHLITCTQCT